MHIIGITGTNGAGKSTIVDILKRNYNYKDFSVREYLTEELQNRGLEVNRDNMRDLANEIRENKGAGYIVKELYKKALNSNCLCIIESIRCVGEIETLRDIAQKSNSQFILLGVDADQKIRYERSIKRKGNLDQISFEQFKRLEELEMQSNDPAKQNLKECLKRADVVFTNNGTLEELEIKVKEYFEKINQTLL
jgi:dephospho-CoA kinase